MKSVLISAIAAGPAQQADAAAQQPGGPKTTDLFIESANKNGHLVLK